MTIRDQHDAAILAAFAALIALLPAAAVFAHLGFAPIVLLLGIAAATRPEVWRCGVARFLAKPDPADPLAPAARALLAFALWVAASGLWSPTPWAAGKGLDIAAPALASGAAVFEILRRRSVTRLACLAAAAFALAVALILFEALSGGLLRALLPPDDPSPGREQDAIELARGATGLIMAGFGASYLIARLWGRIAPALALLALLFLAALRLDVFANVAALLAGAAFFLAARWRLKAATIALAALAVAALFLSPLFALLPAGAAAEAAQFLPLSWAQRVAIWREAAQAALACQPFGCGADFARHLSGAAARIDLPGAPAPLPLMPIHPHSVFLQVFLEQGAVGALLLAAGVALSARALLAAKLPEGAAAAALATAAAAFVSFLVEASLWQVWRLAAPMLAAVFIALALRVAPEK